MSDTTDTPAEDVAGHIVREQNTDDAPGIRAREVPGLRARVAGDVEDDEDDVAGHVVHERTNDDVFGIRARVAGDDAADPENLLRG